MYQNYRITVTNPLGGKEEYQYEGSDSIGWYVSPNDYIPYASSTNNNYASNVPKIRYDYTVVQQKGQISRITYPDGAAIQRTYDSTTGNILSVRDRNGNTVGYIYNSKGKATSETDPNGRVLTMTYASNGVDLVAIDNGFGVERRTYDGTHDLTSVTDRLGNTTLFTYNQYGRVLTATDAAGNTTGFTYDTAGNLVQVSRGTTILGTYTYDEVGRVAGGTDAAGLTLEFAYDDLNHVIRVSYPDGTSKDLTYSSCCPHLITSTTDRAGRTTQFTYNALQKLTGVTYPDGATVNFGYDADMNRTGVTDPNGKTTTFAYDSLDRLIRQTDPTGSVTILSYDANGNRISATDALGNTTHVGYDSMNRVASLTDPAGSVTSFTRDTRGLVTLETDPLGRGTSYVYDAEGNLTGKTDRKEVTLTYAYTATGKLAGITYPGGAQVINTYDDFGRITGMQDPLGTSSYSYDAAGRLASFTDPNGFNLEYAYDTTGNLTRLEYPDGTAVTYGYDALDRLTSVTDPRGGTADYTYDPAGNLAIFTHFNGIITTYTYDEANRLLGMGSIVSDYQFTLDENGNRIHSSETEPLAATPPATALSYGYNTRRNRLLSAGSLGYTYDNEGQISNAGGTAYAFDYDHRLAGIGGDTQFAYDGRGNRLSATRAGVTTRYIYDPWGNLMAIADGANNITARFIYGRGLLATATSDAAYCYHFNANGNTTALTDATQNIVNSYAYDPFGQVVDEQETIPQPFKFVGQFGVMAESYGLYYMRARYYDPSVGRFISEDPIGFAGGDVNFYAYVGNQPIGFIDPWGLFRGDPREIVAETTTHILRRLGLGDITTYELVEKKGTSLLPRVATGIGVVFYITFIDVKSLNEIDDATLIYQYHHPWPKYLGGANQQACERLPRDLHNSFHSGLDKILPRQLGTNYYKGLSYDELQQMYLDFEAYSKAFDITYGTSLWDAAMREGFPLP